VLSASNLIQCAGSLSSGPAFLCLKKMYSLLSLSYTGVPLLPPLANEAST